MKFNIMSNLTNPKGKGRISLATGALSLGTSIKASTGTKAAVSSKSAVSQPKTPEKKTGAKGTTTGGFTFVPLDRKTIGTIGSIGSIGTMGTIAPGVGTVAPGPSTQPGGGITTPVQPGTLGFLPQPPLISPPLIGPMIDIWPGIFASRTTTQLAQGAVEQLEKAKTSVVKEAIGAVKPKSVPGSLMNYLERKVKVGEVLNELAEDWDQETINDFAAAFQMAATKKETMDTIVSLAILNDPDLEEEIRMENTPEVGEGDLLENRRIVWQYPPPGTPLEPPYIIMAAVEHQDVTEAEAVVESIMGKLATYDKFKLPQTMVQKLGRLKRLK